MNRLELLIIIIVCVGMIGYGISLSQKETPKVAKIPEIETRDSGEIEMVTRELFEENYQKAEQIMATMTIEQKVSQLFLSAYPGASAVQQVSQKTPGGYLFFAKDFKGKTREAFIDEISNLQKESPVSLFIAVDEEGGSVVRASYYPAFRSTKFESPQKLGSLDNILQDAKEKSDFLKELGINLNLAPVVDVCEKSSSFIYPRTYGKSYEETAEYAAEVVKVMNERRMISCLKHFPGYGDNVDTHTGIAVDSRAIEEFEQKDFLPFESAIAANAPAVLVNHNIIQCMDETKPATLSKEVHDILREKLAFSGVIITDDLAMQAVKNYVEDGNAAYFAILAGNDMIITSDFEKHQKEVMDAFREGKIEEDTIHKAVRRILAMKIAYGIIK